MVKLFFLFALSILFGCQPTSLEDFQVEGSSLARGLLKDLRKIESREDLSRIEPFLKKDFEKIVDLMILARNFQQKNPELESSFQNINVTLNLSLQEELKRVYEIEGGRECVERAQREAMLKLDGKEKIIEKKERGGRSKNDLFFNLKADPMIFAVAGSPASGKSSFVQERRKEIFSENTVIHDCDAVMVSMEEYQNDLKALGSMRAFQNWELPAREKAESLLMDAVHEKKNIIYDRSCALPSSYNFLQDLFENHGYTLIPKTTLQISTFK